MKKNRLLTTGALVLMTFATILSVSAQRGERQTAPPLTSRANLAIIGAATSSARPGTIITVYNDGIAPIPPPRGNGNNNSNRGPQARTSQWVQYDWAQPVSIKEMDLFWWDNNGAIRLPVGYRVEYWNGSSYAPVANAQGLGLQSGKLNKTTFDEVKTSRLRLQIDSVERFGPPILEWIVYKTDNSPDYAPVAIAGVDRDVIIGGKTYLDGEVKSVTPGTVVTWSKVSGPGTVTFSNPNAKDATATFSSLGDYVLAMTASTGNLQTPSLLKVRVHQAPAVNRLDVVYTKRYKLDSKLWNDRAKAMIVNWIPFCIAQCERTDIAAGRGDGGLDNFIEAAKAIRGEPHQQHKGAIFSNAWVHQTVESMCIALMVDPQGDKEIIAAQDKMREKLDEWIPIIIAAQEPDGYLQTAYTLRDTARWKSKWNTQQRGNHEGYTAGYFIESAINHYTLTEGKDRRLYDAAKKLADCWAANLTPEKNKWYDGHQEMEQALVRFGRFVNDMEGKGSHGDSYIKLAKFLLDNRNNGSDYDQSRVPVQQQYEAVGHAVRATYNYSAMADVAAETHDVDYQSAVMSLWNNMVNKKYYITGGIGSGETAEGFGDNYSLRNDAYCESCSSAGLIFFQYKMNLAYHDAKYADLYEESMYNALLGSLDMDGKNFLYTNELTSSQARYAWHSCPCCVGNIPRTLLMVPTWTYVKGDDGLYVNMFIGSTIKVEKVVGTDVEMVQKTDYPWSGSVSMTVNPKDSKEFTVYVRVPNRQTSELYVPTPAVNSLTALSVNGKAITPKVVNGYVAIKRVWKKGDKIDLVMPMEVQKIVADPRIAADKGLIALRYGPLLYNVESVDQDVNKTMGKGPLTTEWRNDLLHGILTIKGTWADGTPLLAIPNYARLNRNVTTTPMPLPQGRTIGVATTNPTSQVWIKE